MKTALFRLEAMPRLLALVTLLGSAAAFAQEEFTAPPMITADDPGEAPAPGYPPTTQQPQGYPQQQQQGYPQQQPYQQPYPQQYQQGQQPYQQGPYQQYPQQQYPQQGQYQQYPDQQQYQPYPQQQQPQRQSRQQRQRQPPQAQQQGEGFFSSTRSKHFVGLVSGSLGLTNTSAGLVGAARVEFDITRLGFFVGYNNFVSLNSGIQLHQFQALGGLSIFSEDRITWRALAGVDVISRGGLVGTGPVIGTTLRSMFGRVGVDAAVLFTFFPFRALEGRLAFVVNWGVFEAHIGWRLQAIDATQSGTLDTLFTTAPSINGPVVGIGITL